MVPAGASPIGWSALIRRHELTVVPQPTYLYAARQGGKRQLPDGRTVVRLPHRDPESMTDVEHAELALKREGPGLAVLDALLESGAAPTFERELCAAITDRPTGRHLRRLWFLSEWTSGRRLAIADVTRGNYVEAVDPATHLVGPGERSRRHRVTDNLLGVPGFSPVVRRSPTLADASPADLRAAIHGVVSQYDPSMLARALAYLYTKETMSSFAIERERPSPRRAERFVELLKRASDVAEPTEHTLAVLHAQMVEPRFAETGFREQQNYVGESLGLHRQRVHLVPPQPEDLGPLMAAWLGFIRRSHATVDPVVWAACLSFGFVYLHPFIDGNGRLHRFLLQWALAHREVMPNGLLVPVSAVMATRRRDYDTCLEALSRPLLAVIDYTVDGEGELTVHGATARHYRYLDFTVAAESVYEWLWAAIDEELKPELDFLLGLDRTRMAMSQVVDMPDRLTDLFVKLALQNGGRLTRRKLTRHFPMLTDEEVAELEAAVVEHMPVRFLTP